MFHSHDIHPRLIIYTHASQQIAITAIVMALPKHLQNGLTPDELTFLAEEDVISIVPLFSMSRIRVLSVSWTL